MAKKISKRKAKAAVKQIKKLPTWVIVTAIILAVIVGAGYYLYTNYLKKPPYIPPVGELEFHFLTLGNAKAGDSIYVRAGENDILIDAGSDYDSAEAISTYLNSHVTDGKLEYVIVTHGHFDHIAAFAGSNAYPSLFDRYECEVIIDFPKTTVTSNAYEKYVEERDQEIDAGAKHYTALQCWNNEGEAKRVYELADSIDMEILYTIITTTQPQTKTTIRSAFSFHTVAVNFFSRAI
ncbi:MAG: MBL fold metallo-hydrolase [Clostridiales bacterium]|nr:MBL fold metallo-hydrolase [Clostridiales bacterium]